MLNRSGAFPRKPGVREHRRAQRPIGVVRNGRNVDVLEDPFANYSSIRDAIKSTAPGNCQGRLTRPAGKLSRHVENHFFECSLCRCGNVALPIIERRDLTLRTLRTEVVAKRTIKVAA